MATKLKELMETPTASLNISTYTTYDVTNYASATVTIPQYDETIVGIYSITTNCISCTASASNPTSIETSGSATLTFTTSTGYVLPDNITIVGATGTWTKETGTLVLSNATGNVSVTIIAVVQTFTITNNLTNCSKSSGPDSISYGSIATLVYAASGSATLPTEISVTGASYTWSQSTGTLNLSSPTANVTIAITAVVLPDYLCLTANTAGSTISLMQNDGNWSGSYSYDTFSWYDFTPYSTVVTLANVGDKVYVKGTYASDIRMLGIQFNMTGSIAASGNTMSMCCGDNFEGVTTIPKNGVFYGMFENCTALTTAPKLPATTLTECCYDEMFYGCTNLTTPPALPATSITWDSYGHMFYGCSSLQVYNASGTGHDKAWVLPTNGTFTAVQTQATMFYGTTGDYAYSSSSMQFTVGSSRTFYT